MNRPKLFVILPRIPWPLEKGDKLRSYYFVKGLSEYYDITLFALYDERYSNDVLEKIREISAEYHFFRIHIFSVLFHAILAIFTGKPFQVAYFTNYRLRRAVRKAAQQQQPRAVFCQLVRTAQYARGLDCVKILDYQDTLSLGMKRRAASATGMQKWFFRSEGKRLMRYEALVSDWFNHMLIITEQDRMELPVSDSRVHVIPNGVDTDYYSPVACDEIHEMLFVGNMSYPPNINAMEYFVDCVLPGVLEHFPSAEIVIAGARPHSRVKILASDHVIVTGWVDDPRDYYQRSAIFVAPMQIGTGLQNKLLEAMAMQRPCITTDLANNALGARHGDEILVAESLDEWIEMIVALLKNKDERNRIAINGRNFVIDKYSWPAQIKKLHQIIES
ncbi:MAG TPA: glycosyltransferase [Bacteroidales bacterium]|nr:glycosyltransferase [Bacteroidales bacterium]